MHPAMVGKWWTRNLVGRCSSNLNMYELVSDLRQRLLQQLDLTSSVTDEMLREHIEVLVFSHAAQQRFTTAEKQQLIERIFYSFRGLDVIQPLVDDPEITEIMINSHEEIFIERAGEIQRYEHHFESEEKLQDIIQAVVGKVNRVVNESSPIVDARLTDGSRVNVVLPPVSLKGPTMTIRKFPERVITLETLTAQEAISDQACQLLRQLVRAKYNIFISGGTGSGKTTFLNALSACIPSDERIITIEDSAELQIRTIPNLVRLETRNANTEGKGEITMRDLIRSSLRMRPNRIIIGEVRGAECLDMLQAMNTGHDGSLSTGHGNSPKDMLSRLETMVLSGAHLPIEVVRQQIASAIDILVHISRLRDRSRKVTEICEVIGYHNGQYELNPLFTFVAEQTASMENQVSGKLDATGNQLKQLEKWKAAGLEIPRGMVS